MRLERNHPPAVSDEVRAHEREIAPVGADIDDDHAGTEQPLCELGFLRLIPAGKHTSRAMVSRRSQMKLSRPRSPGNWARKG